MIVRVVKAPPDSDLSGDEVGVTSRSTSSEAAVRRASSAGADSSADSPAATSPRWILRLTLVGPPELSESPVAIEVTEWDINHGVDNIAVSTMWSRKSLDVDITALFAIATPDRIGIAIHHSECARVHRTLVLAHARRSIVGNDHVIELEVQLTPEMIFTGGVADQNGRPLRCGISLFRLPKQSDEPANGQRARDTVEAIAWAHSDERGDFFVPCAPTNDEYVIAASDGRQLTAFWRGKQLPRAQTDIGWLQFRSSDSARLAGRITVGGKPLDGWATIRLTSTDTAKLDLMKHDAQIVCIDDKKFILNSADAFSPLPIEVDSSLIGNSFDFGDLPPGSYRLELIETRWGTWSFSGGGIFYQGCFLHPDARRVSVRLVEAPGSELSIDIPASWLSFRVTTEGALDDPFASISVRVSGKHDQWQGHAAVAYDDAPDREPLMVASGESYDIEVLSVGFMPFKTTVTAPPPGETLTVNGLLRRPLDPAESTLTLTVDIPRATQHGIAELRAVLSRPESGIASTKVRQGTEFHDDSLVGWENGSTNSYRFEIPRPAPGDYELNLTFGGRLSPSDFGFMGATLKRACRLLPISKKVVIPEKGDLRIEALVELGGRFVLSVGDRWGLCIRDSAISFAAADGKPIEFGPLLTHCLRLESVSMGWDRHGIERGEKASGSEMIPFLPLPPGRYEVTVDHPDYAPRTVSFVIEAGRDTQVYVVLSPK